MDDVRAPHCDELVLHAPSECEICDKHAAEAQQDRIKNGVNFTGHYDADKKPCPSWVRRGQMAQRWQGNQPWVTVACERCGGETRQGHQPCFNCIAEEVLSKQ